MVSAARILDAPLREDNDAGEATVGEYFLKLLETVWREGENFSSKRPFGNSSWQYDVYRALIDAKLISGTLDEWGDVASFDRQAADALILTAIRALGDDW